MCNFTWIGDGCERAWLRADVVGDVDVVDSGGKAMEKFTNHGDCSKKLDL